MTRFYAIPLTRRDAQDFIARHHRHHSPSIGDIFRVGLGVGGELIAVAQVGRPVARALDDGETLEVTRLCIVDVDCARHIASAMYARCWRIGRELGYTRMITYTLADESGVSLTAAGWRMVHHVKGRGWDTPSRRRADKHPTCDKTLWEVA